MLFTHMQEIKESFSKEFDFNKLSEYKSLIFITLDEQNDFLNILCGNDKDNLYLLFDDKNVKKEVGNLFKNHCINIKVDYNKNFIIIISLENNIMINNEESVTVINVENIEEICKVIDDFKKQNLIQGFFKTISIGLIKLLIDIAKKQF